MKSYRATLNRLAGELYIAERWTKDVDRTFAKMIHEKILDLRELVAAEIEDTKLKEKKP